MPALFPLMIGAGVLAYLALSSSSSSETLGGGKREPGGGGGGGGGDGGTPPPVDTYTPTATDIKNAQQCLILLGLLPSGSADGKMGPVTQKALLAFQKKYDLKTQNGQLTKETADLVCSAGSPIGDLIKGGMSKEAANYFFNNGRSTGQKAATDGQPQDPSPYYSAVGASTAEQQNAFKQGFDVGYLEVMKAKDETIGGAGSGASDMASDVGDVLGGVFGLRPRARPRASAGAVYGRSGGRR